MSTTIKVLIHETVLRQSAFCNSHLDPVGPADPWKSCHEVLLGPSLPRTLDVSFTNSCKRELCKGGLQTRGLQSGRSAVHDSQPARGQPDTLCKVFWPYGSALCMVFWPYGSRRAVHGIPAIWLQMHCAWYSGHMAPDALCMVFWTYGSRHAVHGIPAILDTLSGVFCPY